MKKYLAIIEEVRHKVLCLEAENPSDLLNWNDLMPNLPRDTLDKLRRIDRENDGYWRFADIKSEDDIIKNPLPKRVNLPKIYLTYLGDQT